MSLVWIYHRKDTKSFYIDYAKDVKQRFGKRPHSLRIRDKTRAEAIRRKEEDEILFGSRGPKPVQSIPFSSLVSLFLSEKHDIDGCSDTTLEGYLFALNSFGGSMQVDKNTDDVTEEDVKTYIRLRKDHAIQPKTLRNELGVLHCAFRFALRSNYCLQNPLASIKLPHIKQRDPDQLHDDEYLRLLKAINDPYWQAVFDFYILAGPRRNEAPEISIRRDVNWKARIINIPQTKQDHQRKLPLVGELARVVKRLQSLANGSDRLIQHSGNAIYRRFKNYAKQAGIQRNLRLHSLRHTFGTKLGELESLRTVQELMGHKDPRSTLKYVHPVNEAMKRGIQKLRLPRKKT